MTGSLILGVDLGSHSVRAVVIDQEGHELANASEAFRTYPPDQREPAEWWSVFEKCIRALDDDKRHEIGAMAVTGVRGSVAGFGADGTAVTPGYADFEPSCVTATRKLARERREEIRVETGCPFFPLSGLPKILLHRGNPRIKWWFSPQDYVSWRCTANPVQSAGSALRMGVLTRGGDKIHSSLLEDLGIDPRTIPAVTAIGSRLGILQAPSALMLSLSPGVFVVAAPGDVPAAAVAAGVTVPGTALMSFGTSTVVSAPVVSGLTGDSTMTRELYPRGQRALEVGVGAGGVTFDWLARLVGQPVGELAGSRLGHRPRDSRLRVEPELLSAWGEPKGGQICGITPEVTADAIVEAAAAAIAELAVDLLANLESYVGQVSKVAIGGGAARFAGIPRRVRELKTSSEVELYVGQELAATGSALVAASALVPDPSAQLLACNLWEGT
jgi:xylulokinase